MSARVCLKVNPNRQVNAVPFTPRQHFAFRSRVGCQRQRDEKEREEEVVFPLLSFLILSYIHFFCSEQQSWIDQKEGDRKALECIFHSMNMAVNQAFRLMCKRMMP